VQPTRQEPLATRLILAAYGKAVAVLGFVLGAPVALGVKLLSLVWHR
jgi:hypothetical protein